MALFRGSRKVIGKHAVCGGEWMKIQEGKSEAVFPLDFLNYFAFSIFWDCKFSLFFFSA